MSETEIIAKVTKIVFEADRSQFEKCGQKCDSKNERTLYQGK
jgi:hypothetical protein